MTDLSHTSNADVSNTPSPISRRRFLLQVGGMVGAAGLLSACIAPVSTPAPGASTSEATAVPAVESEETIDYVYGEITATIPKNPQRVVVIEGRGDLDFALSVGYPVIATGNTFNPTELPSAQFAGLLDGVELLAYAEAINFEQLTLINPDLLVTRANAYRGDFYGNDILSQIAPMLPVEANRPTWRTDLVEQANLLQRSEQVDTLLKAYDDKLAAAREEVGMLLENRKVAFMTILQEIGVVVWRSGLGTEVGLDLGMQQPYRDLENPENSFELAEELLTELSDIDLLIRQIQNPTADSNLDGSPTWQALPAVQAGAVYNLTQNFNNGFAITATALLDELVAAAKLLA